MARLTPNTVAERLPWQAVEGLSPNGCEVESI